MSASAEDWRAIGDAAMYEATIKFAIRNPKALYFSPDCAIFFSTILSKLGATECKRPNRSEVEPQFGQGDFDKNLFSS